jgi:hypothetical protein
MCPRLLEFGGALFFVFNNQGDCQPLQCYCIFCCLQTMFEDVAGHPIFPENASKPVCGQVLFFHKIMMLDLMSAAGLCRMQMT